MRINRPFSAGSIVVIIASVLAIVLMHHDVYYSHKLHMNDGLAAVMTLFLLMNIGTRIVTRLSEIKLLVAVGNAGAIFVCVIFYWFILIFWFFYGFNGARLPLTYYFGVVLNTIVFFSAFKPFWKVLEKFYGFNETHDAED
jgi:hypothetical protein